MECGAKVEFETPAPSTSDWNEPLETIVEKEPVEEVAVKRPAISFDWSNVKEESHKKEVPEVHSPWGTTGLGEKELFAEMGEPSDDHSRTMSFIDILKKERDVKAQAAAEEAKPVTENEEPAGDFSAFDDAPSFYVPPMYEDLESPTVTPFDEDNTPAFEEPINEVEIPVFEEKPMFEAEAPEFEESVEDEYEEIEIPSFNESIFASEEPAEEDVYHTTSFDGVDIRATEDFSGLEADLAAILEAGAGKTTVEEEKVDLFEGVSQDESVEDLYLDVKDESPEVEAVEEPKFEEKIEIAEFDDESNEDFGDGAIPEAILDFEPKHGGSGFELEVEDEEDLDEEGLEELESLYISEEDVEDEYAPEVEELVVAEEPVEEPAEELVVEEPAEEPESVESEIEALRRRLAELMGEPEEPEEIAKPEATKAEDLFTEIFATEEPAEETVIEPVEEPVAEFVEEPTVDLVEEPAEEIAENIVTVEEPVEETEPIEELISFEDEFEVELKDEEPEEEDGFTLGEVAEEIEEEVAEPEAEISEEPETDAISLEDLEKDLFGEQTSDDVEPEATKKIDKFYTLYKKNEEFQKLLDEEYNKLQSEEQVPHVADFVPVEVVKDEPLAAVKAAEPEMPVVETVVKEEPVVETPVEEPKADVKADREAVKAAKKAEKEAAKAAKKAARTEAATADDDEEQGGGALTVIAVIVAALLVILLGIILVLNFAPDSAIAMSIDSIIETITSMFSATGTPNGPFLL